MRGSTAASIIFRHMRSRQPCAAQHWDPRRERPNGSLSALGRAVVERAKFGTPQRRGAHVCAKIHNRTTIQFAKRAMNLSMQSPTDRGNSVMRIFGWVAFLIWTSPSICAAEEQPGSRLRLNRRCPRRSRQRRLLAPSRTGNSPRRSPTFAFRRPKNVKVPFPELWKERVCN